MHLFLATDSHCQSLQETSVLSEASWEASVNFTTEVSKYALSSGAANTRDVSMNSIFKKQGFIAKRLEELIVC